MRAVAVQLALVSSLVAACGDDAPNKPLDATPIDAPADADMAARVEVLSVPATVNKDVDVLFMVDDSPSTLDKTTNLRTSFPAFINMLAGVPGGLPSLHIGVVTSDLGTKGASDAAPGPGIGSGPGSCTGNGKGGNLQTQGTALVTGNFISDIRNADGSRSTNYTGTLPDALSAMAAVGATGCGFEQSIEAVKRALDGTNAANTGFLRPSADLVVVMLSDEDDCSMSHSSLMGTDPALGPLQSFRCTRFGITCDVGGTTPDEMNAAGDKSSCHSNETSAYLTRVGDYVSFLKGLKADPRSVMVAALVGPATPVKTELRPPPGGGTAVPALFHSCSYTDAMSQLEVADPAVRITELANQFQHHVVQSVCGDLSPGLIALGHQLDSLQGSRCLTQPIALPENCIVTDQTLAGAPVKLARCPAAGADCYTIATNATDCPTAPQLELQLTRVTAPAADTVTTVSCTVP